MRLRCKIFIDGLKIVLDSEILNLGEPVKGTGAGDWKENLF